MVWLRLIILAGCVGATSYSVANANWQAEMSLGNNTWIMQLGRHPTWNPPTPPDYAAFRDHFHNSDRFPPPDGRFVIRTGYDRFGVVLLTVVYAWPILAVCGLLNLLVRGERRDMLLHCALHTAAGLLLSAVSCVVLWCVIGGWGPPMVECFGVIGVIGGVSSGLATFARVSRKTSPREPAGEPGT